MSELLQAGKPVQGVILHCAAIKTGQFRGLSAYQVFAIVNRWHIERGFSGCGYHYIIMPSGEIFDARPRHLAGAHTLGHNQGTLGVLLIESVQVKAIGAFEQYFTQRQRESVCCLLSSLAPLGVRWVAGHNDYAQKLCPGFHVDEVPDFQNAILRAIA
jgi:hypothetical protein